MKLRIFLLLVALSQFSFGQLAWNVLDNISIDQNGNVITSSMPAGEFTLGVTSSYLGNDLDGQLSFTSNAYLPEGEDQLIFGLVESEAQSEMEQMPFAIQFNQEAINFYETGELTSSTGIAELQSLNISIEGSSLIIMINEVPFVEREIIAQTTYFFAFSSSGSSFSTTTMSYSSEDRNSEGEDPDVTFPTGHSPTNLRNFVHEVAYTQDGAKASESRVYLDKMNRSHQVLIKNLESGKNLAQISKYDDLMRPERSSLVFSTYNSDFNYKQDLFIYNSGSQAVIDGGQGTLGWYYSSNNSAESGVPTSSAPYTRNQYIGNSSEMSAQSLAGSDFAIGSGNENIFIRSFQDDINLLPQAIVPDNEWALLVSETRDNKGVSTFVYEGKRFTVTKVGNGGFCDPDVRVKIEYFDHQGRLRKVVPPEAYDCNFIPNTSESALTHNINLEDLAAGNTVIGPSIALPSYSKNTRDRELQIQFVQAGGCIPQHTIYSATVAPSSGNGGNDPCAQQFFLTNGSLYNNAVLGDPCDGELENGSSSTSPINTFDYGAFTPSTNCYDPETDLLQDKEWTFRVRMKIYGEDANNTSTLIGDDFTYYRVEHQNFTIENGNGKYTTVGYFLNYPTKSKFSFQSLDDADNPLRNSSGDYDLDDFTNVRIELEGWEVTEEKRYGRQYSELSYSPVPANHHLLQYVMTLSLETNLIERDETSEPFSNLSCEYYEYNDRNQLSTSYTPDAGLVKYKYDSQGRLRFSQNAQQRLNEASGQAGSFTYINYDRLGRALETGEYQPSETGAKIYFADASESPYSMQTGDIHVDMILDQEDPVFPDDKYERSLFQYDINAADLPATITASGLYPQGFSHGKVTKSSNANRTVWYGYDQLGRLSWTIQDLGIAMGIKTLAYEYNAKGQISEMIYQRENATERLHHHFSYNANGELAFVYTSQNGSSNLVKRASYEYYEHGGLKRVVLAENMQGMDYLYNIRGQLKSINDHRLGDFDPGQDGALGDPNQFVAADLFGMNLEYDENLQIDVQSWQYAGGDKGLEHQGKILRQEYSYNTFGELAGMQFGNSTYNINLDSYTHNMGSEYQTSINYDRSGNITSLNRNGSALQGLSMDNLTYAYETNANGQKVNNRILQVLDLASSTNYSNDFKNQSSSANYSYSAIGQMIEDAQANRKYSYDNQGLLKEVKELSTDKLLFSFTYNEIGKKQRHVIYNSNEEIVKVINYVYDGGGTLIATQDQNRITNPTPALVLNSAPDWQLIGSNRLGVLSGINGDALYEIKDHLGNVRMVLNGGDGSLMHNSFEDFNATGQTNFFSQSDPNFAIWNHSNDRAEVIITGASSQGVNGIILLDNTPGEGAYSINLDFDYLQPGTGPISFAVVDPQGNNRYTQDLVPGSNTIYFELLDADDVLTLYTNGTFSGNALPHYWVDNVHLQEIPEITAITDYYPYGSVMPGRSFQLGADAYQRGYQGEFAESNMENFVSFDLRQYDPRLGRWISPDPMGQFHSAYLAMANNPVNQIDPTGGFSYYNHECDCDWDTEYGPYYKGRQNATQYLQMSFDRAYSNFIDFQKTGFSISLSLSGRSVTLTREEKMDMKLEAQKDPWTAAIYEDGVKLQDIPSLVEGIKVNGEYLNDALYYTSALEIDITLPSLLSFGGGSFSSGILNGGFSSLPYRDYLLDIKRKAEGIQYGYEMASLIDYGFYLKFGLKGFNDRYYFYRNSTRLFGEVAKWADIFIIAHDRFLSDQPIGNVRAVYRLTGVMAQGVVGTKIGAAIGGPMGAAAGFVAGMVVGQVWQMTEETWDNHLAPMGRDIMYQIGRIEQQANSVEFINWLY